VTGRADGVSLGVVVDLGAALGDLGIEGGKAQMEALGFWTANAVVFGD